MAVTAWIEKIIIPTYKTGKPEKNPMFLEKRVYQGSSGVVYPHPVIEKISDEKTDQEYTAVYLENEYLKIIILPELGGRVQRAYDKIRKRDFVYYNQVIKPALVGLAGPWISGGIEFNWPQHHRPSTFSPVDFTIEENSDGSKTVWVNETEVMFRTKGMAGFTLYPGKAYLEIKGKLFNRTAFPQTFLWWANPAVKVNEHYQSVFPPDVYAVFDHGKRDVSDFPIATGMYYKVDYSPGTDISRYATIPVPTSYMAIRSKYDFMGCYEHDTQAGMLHVANHHFSPGKKQWTWGNGDFGFAWDRNLTDEDGPYIELMTGVFTDNQPDFSWLQPNESKDFEQYFMPYALIGAVKNATKEAMLNMEWENEKLLIKIYATSVFDKAKIMVLKDGNIVQTYETTLSPEHIFEQTFVTGTDSLHKEWKVVMEDKTGQELVSWQPETMVENEIPVAAVAAKLPPEIEQVEDLFLNGQHLEQYRHATFNPMDYYEEGLKRSPEDIRCNNAIGLLLLRRGQFKKAEPYFRTAIKTLTKRNPNPYDGEPYYNLGMCLQLQENLTDAYDAFYKASWNDAFQHSSFLALAKIACTQNKWNDALLLIEKSLLRNYHSPAAMHVKAALLRLTNNYSYCLSYSKKSIKIDPFNYGCYLEQYLVYKQLNDEGSALITLNKLKGLMRDAEQNYLELSLDYAQAGLFAEATNVLNIYVENNKIISPLVYYYLGWFSIKMNKTDEAIKLYKLAAEQNPDLCFPNKIEEIIILKSALLLNPTDAKANYYLGNFWYDKRQYAEAIACWEQAVAIDDSFPTTHRNLSLAYYNKLDEKAKSILFMEKAFALDKTDSRILMELDQLYKISGKGFKERLELLERFIYLVEEREDLYLERITLYNNLQDFEKAKDLLSTKKFHPWEGGEGKVIGQFLLCHIELAKQAILNKQFQQALDFLKETEKYPDNLGEGKLFGTQENDIDYLCGLAYEGLGIMEKANQKWEDATKGNREPALAIFYNDQQPDKIFYQGLAWQKLNSQNKARLIFGRFVKFGEEHKKDTIKIDYFAVSLPDMLVFDVDLNNRNLVFCKYLTGLGYLGLGEIELGKKYLIEVLEIENNHQGAATNLRMIPFLN